MINILEYHLLNQESPILTNAAWKGKDKYVLWNSKEFSLKESLKNHPNWTDKFCVMQMNRTKKKTEIYLDG